VKAVVCRKYGSPEVLRLEEVEKPAPGDNEILVKVQVATVNRTDSAYIRGKPWLGRLITGVFKPKYIIPGTEFAGVIESVGKKVKSFKTGERVFGFNETGSGSQSEYMPISEGSPITLMPEDITYKQAAASTEGAFYAINFIKKVKLESGQRILVNGATGAIGTAAVQLLKYYGAHITAVCRGEHFELVRSLGADDLIDYLREDFTKGNNTYSYIFDTVGKSSFSKCRRLLEPGGVYISSELGFMSQNIFYTLATSIAGSRKVKFPLPTDCIGSVLLVRKLIKEGKYKAVIDREYSLDQIVEAYKYVEKGQKIGNVVISVNDGG